MFTTSLLYMGGLMGSQSMLFGTRVVLSSTLGNGSGLVRAVGSTGCR